MLLLHLVCGHSLRETAVRAQRVPLAELSSVALGQRLKKSQDWLQALCVELFRERGVERAAGGGLPRRAIDAPSGRAPGPPRTLACVCYRSVCSTCPAAACPVADVLEGNRVRGQGERVCKRCQSLAGRGHLPQRADASAQAWLGEQLGGHALVGSSRGYRRAAPAAS